MITKEKPKTKTKNFSLKPEHMQFFKECVSGGAGSYFIQKLVEKSAEYKKWKRKQ